MSYGVSRLQSVISFSSQVGRHRTNVTHVMEEMHLWVALKWCASFTHDVYTLSRCVVN
jgi:hypothetical protein